jgi:hypothetical protein
VLEIPYEVRIANRLDKIKPNSKLKKTAMESPKAARGNR